MKEWRQLFLAIGLGMAATSFAQGLSNGPYAIRPLDLNAGGQSSSAGPGNLYGISLSLGQSGGVGHIQSNPYVTRDGFWAGWKPSSSGLATPTPTPLVQTGTPSMTPLPVTATITHTSTSSAVPSSTESSTPTASNTTSPTFTQEVSLPSVTPVPTPSETPALAPSSTQAATDAFTPTATPTRFSYDVWPIPDGDGQIDGLDLLEWSRRIQAKKAENGLLLDFSQYWNSSSGNERERPE